MKKITMKALANKAPEFNTTVVELEGEQFAGVSLKVKNKLNFDEATRFVNTIVNTIIDAENMTYMPEFQDFVTKLVALEMYAGLPQDDCPIEKSYALIYGTDIFEQVFKHIATSQWSELTDGIDSRIHYIRDMQTSAAALKGEEVLGVLQAMVETGNEAIKGVNTKEFADAVRQLSRQTDSDAANDAEQFDSKVPGDTQASGKIVPFATSGYVAAEQTVDEAVESVTTVAQAVAAPPRRRFRSVRERREAAQKAQEEKQDGQEGNQ